VPSRPGEEKRRVVPEQTFGGGLFDGRPLTLTSPDAFVFACNLAIRGEPIALANPRVPASIIPSSFSVFGFHHLPLFISELPA